MQQIKTIVIPVLLLSLLLASLSGCTNQSTTPASQSPWLESAKLDAEETPDLLYEKALEEETLIVYSTSSRIYDVKKSFETQYPGLTVSVVEVRFNDILTSLEEFRQTGIPFCDIILSSDADGSFTAEALTENLLHKYIPYDILPSIKPQNNQNLLIFQDEMIQLFYNNSLYSSCPVSNWWQLTEPLYKDTLYISNPLRSVTTATFLMTIIEQSDLLADSYEKLYGKPLEIPENSCAGYVFIEKLFKNGLKIANSSDEVSLLVSNSTKEKPVFGIMISSKLRLSQLGYDIMTSYEVQPFCGVYTPNTIMILDQAPNINSAKLFIRWILGETDGSGKGLKPYINLGAWPCRTDVTCNETPPLETLTYLHPNKTFMLKEKENFLNQWNKLHDKYGEDYLQ